jgi:transcriptional regulator with XRE-family HTH domain
MKLSPERVSSGVDVLDRALDSLRIGDNVIWYDTLAGDSDNFLLHFLRISMREGHYLVYVTFDKAPSTLISILAALINYPKLTIIDCFTWGKGAGAKPFIDFYQQAVSAYRCKFVKVEQPHIMSKVVNSVFAVAGDKGRDLRLVFNSLAAANQIWSSDETLRNFYAACCPRLLEQGAIAYWVSSRESQSKGNQAMVNRTAQVVIDLQLKRGVSSFQIVKAAKRDAAQIGTMIPYRVREGYFLPDTEDQDSNIHEFGRRLRALRSRRGLSQSELAKSIGVTPSTISQIESGSCYPSVQALLKIAEVIGPGAGALLEPTQTIPEGPIYPFKSAMEAAATGMSSRTRPLIPGYLSMGNPVHTVQIEPGEVIEGHLAHHKGAELLVVLEGKIALLMDGVEHSAEAGSSILINQMRPTRWWNPGKDSARMILILFRIS